MPPRRRGERRDERLSCIGKRRPGNPEVTHFVLPSRTGEGVSKESVDEGSDGAKCYEREGVRRALKPRKPGAF
jgi:hypothetical protein